jgi:hypothetical protein
MPPPEQFGHNNSSYVHRGLFFLLMLLAIVSAGVGARNGLHHSQDFQWSGARLLVGHVDPWAEYLRGDPDHRIVLTQNPNYLAILYVLILPLGLLPFMAAKIVWIVCNLVFAIVSGAVAARFYGLRGRGVVTVVCLLLMATPVRNSIGNGQQGLLVLSIWCLSLLTLKLSDTRAGLVGLSYCKFNFAPPVFLYLLFRWGVRAALLSLIPMLAAIGLVWLWITGGHDPHALLRIGLEPFAAARTGYTYVAGDQNLMVVMEPQLRRWPEPVMNGVEFGAALGVCLVVSYLAFRRHRGSSVQWQMALMATMSVGLFKHHSYDALVLLLPLCYALGRWQERRAKIVLGLIGYLFYFQRVLEAVHLHPRWAYLVEFTMLMGILAIMYRLREASELVAPELIRTESESRLEGAAMAG